MSKWIDIEKAIEDLQNGDPSQLYDVEDIKYWLNCLPSAQPEQKKGKWIEQDAGGDGVFYECSVCKDAFTLMDGTPSDNNYNFCPNCGADMREVMPSDA